LRGDVAEKRHGRRRAPAHSQLIERDEDHRHLPVLQRGDRCRARSIAPACTQRAERFDPHHGRAIGNARDQRILGAGATGASPHGEPPHLDVRIPGGPGHQLGVGLLRRDESL
jgi:hypothetical protein